MLTAFPAKTKIRSVFDCLKSATIGNNIFSVPHFLGCFWRNIGRCDAVGALFFGFSVRPGDCRALLLPQWQV